MRAHSRAGIALQNSNDHSTVVRIIIKEEGSTYASVLVTGHQSMQFAQQCKGSTGSGHSVVTFS